MMQSSSPRALLTNSTSNQCTELEFDGEELLRYHLYFLSLSLGTLLHHLKTIKRQDSCSSILYMRTLQLDAYTPLEHGYGYMPSFGLRTMRPTRNSEKVGIQY